MDLWSRAKEIIPQGNQLLSKRSEIFPAYYSKCQGVYIDGLIDMSIMGVGCCILGYNDKDVNRAVKDAIDLGSMCTLNCYEEVDLAELLLELHPEMDMVRYARTGGEAMAIAVRIARASTGKDKIAFCGYHGWHDWYLAANLENKTNLDIHLLPNLECAGVPTCLKNTIFPFEFNKIEQLEKIIEEQDIGVIVIEPMRHEYPRSHFLNRIREITNKIGAVLIFDEITIGFRLTIGSSYKFFGVIPDMIVLGKAIANGYPMAVVMGKRKVMEAINKTFISSTFWTERIGSTAAIATIKKMKRIDLPSYLNKIGYLIREGLEELGFKVKFPNSLLQFEIEDLDTFKKKMLKKGYLAGNQIYVSYAHTHDIVRDYLKTVKEIM